MSYALKQYKKWLDDPEFDAKTKFELESIADDLQEIEDRFYQPLQFGTAGLRGVLGAGINRMNSYTVARAADGFARYFVDCGEETCRRGVAISYDSRHFSREFAELTARVFVGYGINVYLSDELRPVPMLSFAVRHYGCAGGVMITASHNPKQYNGFKAYGEDGGQLPPEAAETVASKMLERDDFTDIVAEILPPEEARELPFWHEVGDELDQVYNEMLLKLSINREACNRQKDLKIIYTPLYGSGLKPVKRILSSLGFENVKVVPEQELPDPDFPTAPYPNPEERGAMQLGIDLAQREEADLLIATDPDADRTGVAVRTSTGDFIVLTGNQIGILLMNYILGAKMCAGTLPPQSFCVTTIVSTKLTRPIAAYYNVDLTEVLTGFKYIAEQILLRDEQGDEHFQFGFEESIGYLAGTSVRDKDAVVATMLIAEMAAVAAEDGLTLYDLLQDLYRKFSFASEKTVSLVREGKEGLDKIARVMKHLRREKANGFADIPVKVVKDYKKNERLDLMNGTVSELGLPESNVLLYELDDLDWFCVRPSGTEPKIKIYLGFYDQDQTEADARFKAYHQKIMEYVENLLDAE